MLSVVETLLEFCNILLGQQIAVCTDHTNNVNPTDPTTGWFETVEVPDKKAETAARKLDHVWLCRHPQPFTCVQDNGKEFAGQQFQEMLESYDVKATPTTVKNPQANLVERVHQTLGNMIRAKDLVTCMVTYPLFWQTCQQHDCQSNDMLLWA